jgi:hypothetical protein
MKQKKNKKRNQLHIVCQACVEFLGGRLPVEPPNHSHFLHPNEPSASNSRNASQKGKIIVASVSCHIFSALVLWTECPVSVHPPARSWAK